MAIINGTSIADHLVGTKHSDTIHGLGGDDGLFAGAGNDFVYGDAGSDIVGNDYGDDLLDGGAGTDTVTFNYLNQQNDYLHPNGTIGVIFDLAIATQQHLGALGKDTIVNFENIGGSLANDQLWGSAGANVIGGDEGHDRIDGRDGNDWLYGGWGKDFLTGGKGADRLFGTGPAAGDDHKRDTFVYTKTSESGVTSAAWDHIHGTFGPNSLADRIDLHEIDANPNKAGNQAVHFVGTGPFTCYVGEVRIVDAGGDLKVYIDIDQDNGVEKPNRSPLSLEDHAAQPAGEQRQRYAGQAVEQRILVGGSAKEALEADLAHGEALRLPRDDLAVLEHIGLGDEGSVWNVAGQCDLRRVGRLGEEIDAALVDAEEALLGHQPHQFAAEYHRVPPPGLGRVPGLRLGEDILNREESGRGDVGQPPAGEYLKEAGKILEGHLLRIDPYSEAIGLPPRHPVHRRTDDDDDDVKRSLDELLRRSGFRFDIAEQRQRLAVKARGDLHGIV